MNDNIFEFINIGDKVSFSKTIGETDVYMFAGITGDFGPNHINEEYMNKTPYKKRIAHGVLSIAVSSTATAKMVEKCNIKGMMAVNYGYDRLRFIRPIFISDTITVDYTIEKVEIEHFKLISKIEIFNQNQELCTIGQNILKFLEI
ncbi:MaoC/PaaZ C-terminal domain-containing protein [Bacillus sp. B15-48]|uniref:MaoC family dehydratase n=1 Tax=Bacillus sp. B15-48 TaxID=1548601 RepID=UPI00193EDAE8|nr:MaoC/PaaZ C-terminal domain-containing protein [Bacillus sp. B15-48]MBM4763768.1 dehydratase [Bacillus sp. B15-48]